MLKIHNILIFVGEKNEIVFSTEIYCYKAFISILENNLNNKNKTIQYYISLVNEYGNRILAITSNYRTDIKSRYFTDWELDKHNSHYSTIEYETSLNAYECYLKQTFTNFKLS